MVSKALPEFERTNMKESTCFKAPKGQIVDIASSLSLAAALSRSEKTNIIFSEITSKFLTTHHV